MGPRRPRSSPRPPPATAAARRSPCASRRASRRARSLPSRPVATTPSSVHARAGSRDRRAHPQRAPALARGAARAPRLAGRRERHARVGSRLARRLLRGDRARAAPARPRRRARNRLRGRGALRIPRRHAEALSDALSGAFPAAALVLEPGRSVVGPAGVTLYSVQASKTSIDGTRYVAMDGGMSDNPRPAAVRRALHVAAATRMDDLRSRRSPSRAGTASRATCSCAASPLRRCTVATCSPSPPPAPTRSRWGRTTTSCRGRRR